MQKKNKTIDNFDETYDKEDFYLKSSEKLLSFFNNTLNKSNDSIDLVFSSPTGCMIIVEVMVNYYLNKELTKQNLVANVVNGISQNMNQSSVYKLVDRAIEKNIFISVLKDNDKRVHLIVPSSKTINDMQIWFDDIKLV